MRGSLSGIRIVDLSFHISGPFGTCMLADQGADVIKLEPPGEGDGLRYPKPAVNGISAMFAAVNRNKRSLALDIRKPEGQAVLADLVKGADVLVQNFRPGVMERLGLSWEQAHALNPALIYVSINGFGASGPYAARRAYDGIMQASVGLPTMQADAQDGEPRLLQTAICDKVTALVVAQAITSAVCGRLLRGDGIGEHVEVPMMDSLFWFLFPDNWSNHVFRGPDAPPPAEFSENFRLRRTRDGHLMVVMSSQKEFVAVCEVLGCPELATDPRFDSSSARSSRLREVNDTLAPLFAQHDTATLHAALLAADVPVARVSTIEELIGDPHVVARGLLREIEQPGAGPMLQVKHPAHFSTSDTARWTPAPGIGEHSREILAELGYAPARIASLFASGIVATTAAA